MTTLSTASLLKYANLQMAAEAFLVTGANDTPKTGELLTDALVDGNFRNSKFTESQAQIFADQWEVVAQKPNTSTGFSGTLFKYTGPTDAAKGVTNGELVLSMRSTEFVDDAAHDNQATNTLEIKETGWAFGQIRDMEAWYQQLATDQKNTAYKANLLGKMILAHIRTAIKVTGSFFTAKPILTGEVV